MGGGGGGRELQVPVPSVACPNPLPTPSSGAGETRCGAREREAEEVVRALLPLPSRSERTPLPPALAGSRTVNLGRQWRTLAPHPSRPCTSGPRASPSFSLYLSPFPSTPLALPTVPLLSQSSPVRAWVRRPKGRWPGPFSACEPPGAGPSFPPLGASGSREGRGGGPVGQGFP